MEHYTKNFDRKLRCDDIPGAQPKVRHYDRRPVRNYPNQMMASISKDEEQNVRQYMNDKITQDEHKYQTYRNVVDHQQKIDQVFQNNSQVFDQTASRQTLKAMHQNISKNLIQNESQLMNIVDNREFKEEGIRGGEQQQEQIQIQQRQSQYPQFQESPLKIQRNNNRYNNDEIDEMSQSKVMQTPPKAKMNSGQKQFEDNQLQDFYNLDNYNSHNKYNNNYSGEKLQQQQSVTTLPQQNIQSLPQRMNSLNRFNEQKSAQNIINGGGSKLLKEAYGENVYSKNFSDQKQFTSGSVERLGKDIYNRGYYSDNVTGRKLGSQQHQFQSGGQRQDRNIFINQEQSVQQLPQIQPFNHKNQLNEREMNQNQRKRILSYNIITNNAINYHSSKPQPDQLPYLNHQNSLNNQSFSVDRAVQYQKLQNHPQQENSSFTVNYILPTPQDIQQNPFRQDIISDKRGIFNRRKNLAY